MSDLDSLFESFKKTYEMFHGIHIRGPGVAGDPVKGFTVNPQAPAYEGAAQSSGAPIPAPITATISW